MSERVVSTATGGTPPGFRVDIQALRAIAIIIVVVFHAWPARLPGGFVGVDVFFVISGYLITSHLLRQATSAGGLKLGQFYARRMRRLLPASLLTLVCTTLVVLVFRPELEWLTVLPSAIAAALYSVNWVLAADSVDYFAAEASNPFQHFWSLSVEEQFYIAWPLLVLLGVFLSAKLFKGIPRTAVIASVLGVVAATSLIVSVTLTAELPTVAYFATPARAWEFAAGGLLALAPGRWVERIMGSRFAPWAAWAGLGMIAWAAYTYRESMQFPGWIALLPVIGTLLVIIAGVSTSRFAPTWFYVIPPIQWVGGISYSLYLWHWPVLILGPTVLVRLGFPSLDRPILLIGIAVVLAWLSRRFVEDPIIHGRALPSLQGSTWRTVGATALAMAVTVAVAFVPMQPMQMKFNEAHAERESVVRAFYQGEPCIGGDALTGSCASETGEFVPAPLIARSDRPADECQQAWTSVEIINCEFGDPNGTPVAIIGDSHMTQWVTAFKHLAEDRGWALTTYLRGGCPVIDTDKKVKVSHRCQQWSEAVLTEMLSRDFEIIFTSARDQYERIDDPERIGDIVAALSNPIRRLQDDGAHVIAIADTPNPYATRTMDVPQCVAERGIDACAMPRSSAVSQDDPITLAARETGATLIDTTDLFCSADVCPAVTGGVLVYRDNSHFSETYLLTIEDDFARLVDRALSTTGS